MVASWLFGIAPRRPASYPISCLELVALDHNPVRWRLPLDLLEGWHRPKRYAARTDRQISAALGRRPSSLRRVASVAFVLLRRGKVKESGQGLTVLGGERFLGGARHRILVAGPVAPLLGGREEWVDVGGLRC